MTEIVNNATIRVAADSSGVEAGLRPAIDAAQRAGQAITQTGSRASGTARAVESAQRNIIASIQRTTMAMEAGGRTTAVYYETLGRQRGVDPASLTPYLNQLRAVEAAQTQATESTRAQAAAARDLAQAQASKESFLAGLREQIALFGKSTEEVLRYRAAQAGASQEAAHLILQLQNMRAAQEQVESAARAAAVAQREAAAMDASRNAFLAGLREQIALFGLATDEVQRYRAAQLGIGSAAEPFILQLRDQRLAQEQAAYAARMEAQAQREAAQARASRTSFLGGLEQQAQAIGKTRIELLEMQAAQLGVTAQAKPFIDQLRAADQALQSGGMSARAMNAALRGVPAQLTDIVVSLQGGQAPLTVFLQQGGQLRDMFGSAGGAVRALGGAVLNLVTPYTAVAAAVGTLAFAYKAGHDEAIRYSRALIMTGNIAGTTAGQMADMAASMEEINGSQATSAKALTTLASTGAIAGGNLEKFGTVAVDAQRVLGKSVEDTAKEFAALGKDPLTALRAMGDQYNFVTTETYLAVKAAQEQGRTIEAASIAQNAYADGIANQKQKVLDSLSAWERGWISIKTAVGGAWDSVVEFAGGREAGPDQRLAALDGQRKAIEDRIARLQRVGKSRDGERYDPSKDRDVLAAEAQLAANQRAVDAINKTAEASEKAAQAQAKAAKAQAVERKWVDEQKILKSRAELLKLELEAATTEGRQLGVDEEILQNQLLAIRRKYNDVYVAGIDNSITALRKRGELEDVLAQRALAQIQAQRDAGEISEEDAIRQTAARQIADLSRVEAGLRSQLALTSKKIGSQREQLDLEGQIATIGQQRISREDQLEKDLAAARRTRAQESNDLYLQGLQAAQAELDGIASQVSAQKLANEEIGLSKTAVADLASNRLNAAAALKEEAAAAQDALPGGQALAEIYRQQAAELRSLAQARQTGTAKQDAFDATRKAREELNQFLDPGRAQTFGEALREAFGGAGDSVSKLTASLDGFARRQAEIAKHRSTSAKDFEEQRITELQYMEEMSKLSQAETKDRMAGYGAMAGAAAGFFGEQSKGYQALMVVSKVFHAAELAMTLAELVPKGIAAVLNQGSGDPYSAFGRMAAMAAIVAGLGVAIGGVGSGGVSLSESRQKTQGTGSVLGSDDKSASIANSLELIESATSKHLGISTGMLTSLRNIEAGIGQFASLLVRTTGVSGEFGADFGTGYSGLSKGIGKAGMLGGGIAGGMAGGAIASVMTMGSVGTLSTTALGAIAGPLGMVAGAVLGAVFGKQLGKVSNAIFGGKKTVEDTGFTMGATNFGSILANGVNASQYADVKTDGGFFGRDKVKPVYEGLGAEGNRQISTILTSLYGTVFEAGKMLGINGDAFAAQLNSFVVNIGKVSLKGKTGEQIQEELSAIFSKVGDDLASFGIAGITQFQKVGEGALGTLARVATNYASLDAVLSSISMSFGATGVASIGAREELLQLAGGIDELAGQVSSFAENYLTEAERLVPVQKYVTEQLASMGLATTLKSRESFKQYVLGLDLTNAAQRAQYVQLMNLQDAFAQLYPEMKDVEDKTKSIADAKAALVDAYNAESEAIGATIDRISSFAASLKSLRENALLGGLSPLSPQQKYVEAKAQYEAVLAAARAGDQSAQSNYQGAFNAFLTASRAVFASSGQYQRDFDFAQTATAEAARWAEQQVDVGKQQLTLLKSQVSGLIDVNKSVLSVREAILQLLQAEGKAPAGPQMPAPTFYVSSAVYGTPSTEPLVAEIKALRQELSTLRAEQADQTGHLIQSQERSASNSADRIADATAGAVKVVSYREQRVAPE